jgi:hypothetical protein
VSIEYLERAEQAVLAIASGDWTQDDMTAWLQAHLSAPGRE